MLGGVCKCRTRTEGIHFIQTEGVYFSSESPSVVSLEAGSPIHVEDVGGAGASSVEKKRGRPSCLSGEKLDKLCELYYSTSYSLREIAKILGVSRMSVWRTVQTMN